MEEREERRDDERPSDDGREQQPSAPDAQRSFNAGGGDLRDRPRRRGRRGRGGGPRFPGPVRTPGAPADDEESSQARELAAWERRQQQQRRPAFRGPGWVAGSRPPTSGAARGPAAGGFRPGGGAFRGSRPQSGAARGPRRGPSYTEQIRRVTAGPRAQAAPSHEAGEPIAGPHAVLEAMRAGRVVKRLFVSNERGTRTGAVNELIEEAQQRRIFVRYVEPMEIQRLSPIENHQGVVAIVEGKAGVELEELLLHLDAVASPLVLAIDSLQDPQNFGVLLRSAEGTGVDGVIIPKHRAVGLTPAVAKTSAGASEHLMISEVANLRQAIDALKEKGVWVVATDETGDLLYDEVDYRGPTAVVIGGEAEGIRRLVLEGCDQVVRIPMEGHVASLNAAAAGTVVLYEALRQRRRNVAPADTRTPPPARPEALTPQEEGMSEALEGDEAELEPEALETAPVEVAETSMPTEPAEEEEAEEASAAIVREEDAAIDITGEPDAIERAVAESSAEAVGESEAEVPDAPTKRTVRAKKTTTTRKTSTRKSADP